MAADLLRRGAGAARAVEHSVSPICAAVEAMAGLPAIRRPEQSDLVVVVQPRTDNPVAAANSPTRRPMLVRSLGKRDRREDLTPREEQPSRSVDVTSQRGLPTVSDLTLNVGGRSS
jgi:hypothetical protein